MQVTLERTSPDREPSHGEEGSQVSQQHMEQGHCPPLWLRWAPWGAAGGAEPALGRAPSSHCTAPRGAAARARMACGARAHPWGCVSSVSPPPTPTTGHQGHPSAHCHPPWDMPWSKPPGNNPCAALAREQEKSWQWKNPTSAQRAGGGEWPLERAAGEAGVSLEMPS